MSSRRICQARWAEKTSESEREDEARSCGEPRQCDQRHRERVEQREHGLGALAEQQRRRLDADQRVVVAILMGVDGVIADHPGNRAAVEQDGGKIEPPERRRPSHQRAPGEGKTEHDLRPIGDPFHERIDRDHEERRQADIDREAIELQQNRQPEQRLQHQKGGGGGDGDLSGRNRPRARALDPRVEIAVDDVVPGATGPAHGEGADEEQEDVPEIDVGAGLDRGEPHRPPARHQQQP